MLDRRRITYLTGIIGVSIIVLTILATALVFSGPDGTAYSMLNRKISTLGKPEFSGWAALFNWGLQIGGLFLIGFMVGLGLYVGRWAMFVVVLAGILMASGIVLVGVCPVTQPQCHKLAAQIVFISGAASVVSFTGVLLWVDQEKLSRWLVVPSAIASLAFILFVLIPYSQYDEPQRVFFRGPPGEEHPSLWLPSLLEWVVFCSVVIWIVTIAVYLYRQEQLERRVYRHDK